MQSVDIAAKAALDDFAECVVARQLHAAGLAEAAGLAFVLPAGGLGERLGFSGVKLALPSEIASGASVLAVYAGHILALQRLVAARLGRADLQRTPPARHEFSYTRFAPGASLARHVDEHHEETKGTEGWRAPTRRSVTWLVYLNERDVAGGRLGPLGRAAAHAEARLDHGRVATGRGRLG